MIKSTIEEINERKGWYEVLMELNPDEQRIQVGSMDNKDKYYFMRYISDYKIKIPKENPKEKSLVNYFHNN